MSLKVQMAIGGLYIGGLVQGVILGVYMKWTIKDTIKFWRGRSGDSTEGK